VLFENFTEKDAFCFILHFHNDFITIKNSTFGFNKKLTFDLIKEHNDIISLCYIICKNLPYIVTYSDILDQLYPHLIDGIYG